MENTFHMAGKFKHLTAAAQITGSYSALKSVYPFSQLIHSWATWVQLSVS